MRYYENKNGLIVGLRLPRAVLPASASSEAALAATSCGPRRTAVGLRSAECESRSDRDDIRVRRGPWRGCRPCRGSKNHSLSRFTHGWRRGLHDVARYAGFRAPRHCHTVISCFFEQGFLNVRPLTFTLCPLTFDFLLRLRRVVLPAGGRELKPGSPLGGPRFGIDRTRKAPSFMWEAYSSALSTFNFRLFDSSPPPPTGSADPYSATCH